MIMTKMPLMVDRISYRSINACERNNK